MLHKRYYARNNDEGNEENKDFDFPMLFLPPKSNSWGTFQITSEALLQGQLLSPLA